MVYLGDVVNVRVWSNLVNILHGLYRGVAYLGCGIFGDSGQCRGHGLIRMGGLFRGLVYLGA